MGRRESFYQIVPNIFIIITLCLRPNAVRTRSVYNMKIDLNMEENEHMIASKEFVFKLMLCTQAGTYVKEFVHGDFGRTSPNLCSILNCDVDIVALDVEVNINGILVIY